MTIFHGTFKGGKFHLDIPKYFANFCLTFKDGQKGTITLKKFYKQRSLPENSYFHGVIVPMIHTQATKDLGWDFDDTKMALKREFLSEIDPATGLTRVKSTSSLNTVEFFEFCEDCCRWASVNLGLYIPPPIKKEDDEPKKTRTK
jgi:hypothetical protein